MTVIPMQRTRPWSMRPFAEVPTRSGSFNEPAPWEKHIVGTCKHERSTVRLKEYAGGLKARRQCETCWQGVGQLVSKAGVTGRWNAELEKKFRDEYESEMAAWRKRRDEHFAGMAPENNSSWRAVYNAYLKSPQWMLKRGLVIERCGGVCECCGQQEVYEVHHVDYPRPPMQWGQEPLWWLRGVCYECHGVLHPHMERDDAIRSLCR